LPTTAKQKPGRSSRLLAISTARSPGAAPAFLFGLLTLAVPLATFVAIGAAPALLSFAGIVFPFTNSLCHKRGNISP
jgi:hypothetical protein